jgi:hypothetical protein
MYADSRLNSARLSFPPRHKSMGHGKTPKSTERRQVEEFIQHQLPLSDVQLPSSRIPSFFRGPSVLSVASLHGRYGAGVGVQAS